MDSRLAEAFVRALLAAPAADSQGLANISKEWCVNMAKLEPAEGFPSAGATGECDVPPNGWRCSREKGHEGPCAASRIDAADSQDERTANDEYVKLYRDGDVYRALRSDAKGIAELQMEGWELARAASSATAPLPRASDAATLDDLAMLAKQLVHALRKHEPKSALAARTLDYLRQGGLIGSPLRAAAQPVADDTGARYIVIGYGETDHPQAAFARTQDGLLNAALGMIYMHPDDADEDYRAAMLKDLQDEDEWSEGIWRTEFEIGVVVIYDLGYGTVDASDTGVVKTGEAT
jgi:hypothetical protein